MYYKKAFLKCTELTLQKIQQAEIPSLQNLVPFSTQILSRIYCRARRYLRRTAPCSFHAIEHSRIMEQDYFFPGGELQVSLYMLSDPPTRPQLEKLVP
jgi:hypothetical protein